jgi:hypothetical protein
VGEYEHHGITANVDKLQSSFVFPSADGGEPLLQITPTAFIFKGKAIDDAGEAHAAFTQVMDAMRNRRAYGYGGDGLTWPLIGESMSIGARGHSSFDGGGQSGTGGGGSSSWGGRGGSGGPMAIVKGNEITILAGGGTGERRSASQQGGPALVQLTAKNSVGDVIIQSVFTDYTQPHDWVAPENTDRLEYVVIGPGQDATGTSGGWPGESKSGTLYIQPKHAFRVQVGKPQAMSEYSQSVLTDGDKINIVANSGFRRMQETLANKAFSTTADPDVRFHEVPLGEPQECVLGMTPVRIRRHMTDWMMSMGTEKEIRPLLGEVRQYLKENSAVEYTAEQLNGIMIRHNVGGQYGAGYVVIMNGNVVAHLSGPILDAET